MFANGPTRRSVLAAQHAPIFPQFSNRLRHQRGLAKEAPVGYALPARRGGEAEEQARRRAKLTRAATPPGSQSAGTWRAVRSRDESDAKRRQRLTFGAGSHAEVELEDIQKLQQLRNRDILLIANGHDHADIEVDTVELVNEALGKLTQGHPLDVVLDSEGGEVTSAFKVAKLIAWHSQDVNVIVPRRARSAAVFLCLVAKQVLMASTAELGPLDPRVRDGSGSYQSSSQAGRATVAAAIQLQVQVADAIRTMLAGHFDNLSQRDIAMWIPRVAKAFTPLKSGLNLRELGLHLQAREACEYYGNDLMEHASWLTAEESTQILHRLIYSVPHHDTAILWDAARSLGLPVDLAEPQVSNLALSVVRSLEDGACIEAFGVS